MPKTKEAQKHQEFLSPFIWNLLIKLDTGVHIFTPRDFEDMVNKQLVSNGGMPTTAHAICRVLKRGVYHWFSKMNHNRYRFYITDGLRCRISEDLLPENMIPVEYQRNHQPSVQC